MYQAPGVPPEQVRRPDVAGDHDMGAAAAFGKQPGGAGHPVVVEERQDGRPLCQRSASGVRGARLVPSLGLPSLRLPAQALLAGGDCPPQALHALLTVPAEVQIVVDR